MHTRKQIIENQKIYRDEILDWLKNEFKSLKKELISIESNSDLIKDARENLIKKFKKVKTKDELEKFFISYKNIYPKYYAWWDNDIKEVIKHKYNND